MVEKGKKDKIFIRIFRNISVCIVMGGLINLYRKRQLQTAQWNVKRFQAHFWLLNHWLEIKNEGKSVASYFEAMGYHRIAVYGMAELGNRLMEDLKGSAIQIDYGIDRDIPCSIAWIDKVYYPEDELPETDAIVVTPYSMFGEIKEQLGRRVGCPIISLEEVVWSV